MAAGSHSSVFATSFALFLGAPLGLVTFSFIGFRVGRRLEENARQQLAADQKCDSGRPETALPTDEPLLQERPSQR
jgi:hypothetical protein